MNIMNKSEGNNNTPAKSAGFTHTLTHSRRIEMGLEKKKADTELYRREWKPGSGLIALSVLSPCTAGATPGARPPGERGARLPQP